MEAVGPQIGLQDGVSVAHCGLDHRHHFWDQISGTLSHKGAAFMSMHLS